METNEPVKITKKITGYKVVTPEEAEKAFVELLDTTVTDEANKPLDNNLLERVGALVVKAGLIRPLRLDNEWRLKPPYANHALYVRLNAITHEGKKYPYEIFFNTKDVKDIKWLNALTVTISTAFRTAIETGTSLQPLIDNFKESCDTESPYLSRVPEKPKFVNGLVAELGLVIEFFNKECLAWNYSESSHARPATEEELKAVTSIVITATTEDFLLDKVNKVTNTCPNCGSQLTKQSGCDVCLSCSYSKCG